MSDDQEEVNDLITPDTSYGDDTPDNSTNDDTEGRTDVEETEGVEADPEAEGSEDAAEVSADDEEIEVILGEDRYKVPKNLAELVEAGRTYTTEKEQIAADKAAYEAQVKQFSEQSEAQYEQLESVAQLHSLDAQIAEFNRVDWTALSNADPVQAQQLFMQAQQLKDGRQTLAQQIEQKGQELANQKQQATAQRIAESDKILAKEIKGWSPQREASLVDYAVKSFGFSESDVKAAKADPRIFKLLNAAYANSGEAKKVSKVTPIQQGIKPVTKLTKGGAKVGKDPDKMSAEEWRDYRLKQMQSKSKRG